MFGTLYFAESYFGQAEALIIVVPLKPITLWTNNIIKNPTSYTKTVETATIWTNETPTEISYTYNQAGYTYNQAGVFYNYLNVNANETNTKKSAVWSAT